MLKPPLKWETLSTRSQAVKVVHRAISHSKATRGEGGALPKPRLDYRAIINNPQYKSHNAFNRQAKLPVNTIPNISRLYESSLSLSKQLNNLRTQRSIVGDRVKKGGDGRAAAVQEAKEIKAQIQTMEKQLSEVESQLLEQALLLPNDTHPLSPLGPEDAAVTLSMNGSPPTPPTPERDHVSLNHALQFMDLDSGSTASGSSWYFLRGYGAMLELALTNYAMSVATRRGFVPFTTPDVVKEEIAIRCGFRPRDEEGAIPSQTYYLHRSKDAPQLVLAGTAEIPLSALFAGKTFEPSSLPLKVVGLGRAFRAEAGARGADTRGLYRVHQFSKVELFAVCEGDVKESTRMMEEMRDVQQEIFNGLGLTYRVLDMPTEELGASAYRKYDMEAWMPGRGSWGEISSLSNCTDYQARRLHIRHKLRHPSDNQSLPFAHTLNGTAAAIPRLIVALIENGAKLNSDGVITGLTLPKALKLFWLGPDDATISWV
ncbi:Serine--tRNA ligase, mitochondrial [Tulasnella sp. 418]|nr:Serine--tRNA ligase, mitochondrial [Tulasnella sp. 418]